VVNSYRFESTKPQSVSGIYFRVVGVLYQNGKGHYCRIVFGRRQNMSFDMPVCIHTHTYINQFNISAKQD